jgi:hypothetical protein
VRTCDFRVTLGILPIVVLIMVVVLNWYLVEGQKTYLLCQHGLATKPPRVISLLASVTSHMREEPGLKLVIKSIALTFTTSG